MPCDPNEQGREDRGAEDDPERGLCQIAARRLLGKLARDEFEIAFDQRAVGARLVDLPQCELALICHNSRHQRRTFARPRNTRNLKFCPPVSGKFEWPKAVLGWSAERNLRMF
jgi:hypothetical protein